MSVENALRALLETIRDNAACAPLFGTRIYDRTPGDLARSGVNLDLPEGQLRCWLGPMNMVFGDECRGHSAQLRIYIEGMTQSRAPVWNAALAVATALSVATNPAFGTVALLRPLADVFTDGPEIGVAIDIGFRIPG